jgi:hypothetical protein
MPGGEWGSLKCIVQGQPVHLGCVCRARCVHVPSKRCMISIEHWVFVQAKPCKLPAFLQPWHGQILLSGLQLRVLAAMPAPLDSLATRLADHAASEAALWHPALAGLSLCTVDSTASPCGCKDAVQVDSECRESSLGMWLRTMRGTLPWACDIPLI